MQLCVCDESADVAPGPATQFAEYRRWWKRASNLGGIQHTDFYMMRIRGCHVTGEFVAHNVALAYRYEALVTPNREPEKIILPPFVYAQEREKRASAAGGFVLSRTTRSMSVSGDMTRLGSSPVAAHTTP